MKKKDLIFKLKNFFNINYLLSIIVFASFIFGLIANENSSGGAEQDVIAILNNVELFNNYTLSKIPWDKYNSTSLPLFYISLKLLFNEVSFSDMILTNFLISISIFIIFFYSIKMKFAEVKIENSYLFLLSTIIFLSPYLRSSTFWGLEEIIGIFFFTLSLFFYEKYKKNKKILFMIVCLLSASLALFSRQSYIFLVFFLLFELINFKKIFEKKNIYIVFFLCLFNLPILYFFFIWNGLLPPHAQETRSLSIYLVQIPIIISILFIYFIPTILINFESRNSLIKFFEKSYIYIFLISILFFLVIYFSDLRFIGGGAFLKIMYLIKLNKFFLSLLTSLFSAVFLIYLIFYFETRIIIFFLIIVSIFCSIDLIFQEYFDPISFIAINILFLSKSIKLTKFYLYTYFSLVYYSVFLIGSLFYYNL